MKQFSVLFVCLGNICRSPAAEAIFLDLLSKKKIKDKFLVDSAGTGSWHIGKKADSRMRFAAKQRNLEILSKARQFQQDDFYKFNYILTMDNSNFEHIINLRPKSNDTNIANVLKMQEFSSKFEETEVPDPYFGGEDGFDYVLDILEDSVSGFLKDII